MGAAPASSWAGSRVSFRDFDPFTAWSDYANYVRSPPTAGSRRAGGGWSLSGGARAASGNESYYVHSKTDKTSLVATLKAHRRQAPDVHLPPLEQDALRRPRAIRARR